MPRPRRFRIPVGAALRNIRNEIELLEATQGSYYEMVLNIKLILSEAGLKTTPTPEAASRLTHEKLPPLSEADRSARDAVLSKRGPRS